VKAAGAAKTSATIDELQLRRMAPKSA
jgi:hypothetical protein